MDFLTNEFYRVFRDNCENNILQFYYVMKYNSILTQRWITNVIYKAALSIAYYKSGTIDYLLQNPLEVIVERFLNNEKDGIFYLSQCMDFISHQEERAPIAIANLKKVGTNIDLLEKFDYSLNKDIPLLNEFMQVQMLYNLYNVVKSIDLDEEHTTKVIYNYLFNTGSLNKAILQKIDINVISLYKYKIRDLITKDFAGLEPYDAVNAYLSGFRAASSPTLTLKHAPKLTLENEEIAA